MTRHVKRENTSKTYVVIEFPRGSWSGGLGDRLVGLVSAIMLAEVLQKSLLIKWDSPSIHGVLDLTSYNYYLSRPSLAQAISLHTIDNRFKFQHVLGSQPIHEQWKNLNVWVKCNQELGQFLYQNPHLAHLRRTTYEAHTLSCYQRLFSTFLIPVGIKNVQHTPTVAIQLRTGDAHMGVGDHRPIKNVSATLQWLAQHVGRQFPSASSIYFSTDHPTAIHEFRRHLSQYTSCQVYHNAQSQVHLDRSNVAEHQFKALITDLLTLTQAQHLIISSYSNFGRLAALIASPSSNRKVYGFSADLHVNLITNLHALFTKHSAAPPPQRTNIRRSIRPTTNRMRPTTHHQQRRLRVITRVRSGLIKRLVPGTKSTGTGLARTQTGHARTHTGLARTQTGLARTHTGHARTRLAVRRAHQLQRHFLRRKK
jgi:hypothetical protein